MARSKRSVRGALAITMRPVADLVPYARNARTHSPKQISMIARSIERYGFNNPILVDGENGVVAGHGRLAAALLLKLATVPVIELAHLSGLEKREYIIADNKLAERAGWDETLLKLEATDMAALGADFSATGLAQHELDRMLRPEFQDADESLPALSEHIVSRAGDVWVLEGHRIACGDATDAGTVARLLGDVRPHLMVTDPPYGVDYDPAWRDTAASPTAPRSPAARF